MAPIESSRGFGAEAPTTAAFGNCCGYCWQRSAAFNGDQERGSEGSVRVAIVIGTILILINYGLPVPPRARMALTVCVPLASAFTGG